MYTYCKGRMLLELHKCSLWFEQSRVRDNLNNLETLMYNVPLSSMLFFNSFLGFLRCFYCTTCTNLE